MDMGLAEACEMKELVFTTFEMLGYGEKMVLSVLLKKRLDLNENVYWAMVSAQTTWPYNLHRLPHPTLVGSLVKELEGEKFFLLPQTNFCPTHGFHIQV